MSLRARLLIVTAILLTTYGITAVLVVQNQRSLLIEQVDRRLVSIPPFRVTAAPTGAPELPPAGPADSFSDTFIGLVDQDGALEPRVVGSLLDSTPSFAIASDTDIEPMAFRTITDAGTGQEFRAYFQPAPGNQGVMITALPLQEVNDAISRLERTLIVAGVLVFLILMALYVWIQRLGIAPIARLARTADAVTVGDHTQRAVDVDPRTEAGKLGIAFNAMLDERDEAEARLRQFIADASHELRTPLTSMRGYLDLYKQGAFREVGQLDDVLRRMSSETARMTDLVKDLLALASLDEGRPLRYDRIDLGRILRDSAQDARAVQPTRPIAADTPDDGPMICADEGLIVQLVSILVSNALHHTPVDAALVLRVSRERQNALITISDSGPGLDSESAAHAFDRFWRGEASRKRSASGGSGLGLSIAKSIVDAHHGSIALDTTPDSGTTFTIRLPATPERCAIRDTVPIENRATTKGAGNVAAA
ncbi:MAG: HAMP domain-containing histidine kinase [Thermomicrobiales bacterium]|nr:HAMP domain-containing histidine kinase [Thermomicrobiales bacterium]MCO5220286.1 HAMP domain-containing histidine kinase [Thermomicrobiales bacterium]